MFIPFEFCNKNFLEGFYCTRLSIISSILICPIVIWWSINILSTSSFFRIPLVWFHIVIWLSFLKVEGSIPLIISTIVILEKWLNVFCNMCIWIGIDGVRSLENVCLGFSDYKQWALQQHWTQSNGELRKGKNVNCSVLQSKIWWWDCAIHCLSIKPTFV